MTVPSDTSICKCDHLYEEAREHAHDSSDRETSSMKRVPGVMALPGGRRRRRKDRDGGGSGQAERETASGKWRRFEAAGAWAWQREEVTQS